MEEEKFLTSPEVAKILGVTSASINKWSKLGYFPRAYRINPMSSRSAWRIPEGDVKEFIEKRRKERGFIRLPAQPDPRPKPPEPIRERLF